MKWHKCQEEMPGQEYDIFYNKELSIVTDPGFLVSYHHGDDEPWLCRAFLKNGKFIIHEFCHYSNPETYEECPDPYQNDYWEGCIVTHWLYLEWPEDLIIR